MVNITIVLWFEQKLHELYMQPEQV